MYLKVCLQVPGGPEIRTQRFHCRGLIEPPGQVSKILQAIKTKPKFC